jgi:hypothetical protein
LRQYSIPCGFGRLGRSLSLTFNKVSCVKVRLLPFHAEAADQARVVYMPDTAWPVSGHPPDSSRNTPHAPVSMSPVSVTTLHQRFACARLPDPYLTHTCAFSSSLTTTVFSQRSMRRFDASPAGRRRRATTFISRAAAHQEALPTPSSSFPCSGHTWGSKTRCSVLTCAPRVLSGHGSSSDGAAVDLVPACALPAWSD